MSSKDSAGMDAPGQEDVEDFDFRVEAGRTAEILSRPLPKQVLRRMAMQVVHFNDVKEIVAGERAGPKKGKTLRDAVHAEEKRIKALRKSFREGLEDYAAGNADLEWMRHSYANRRGEKIKRAGYVILPPEPRMPSAAEAAQRMMEALELERAERPERFLDEVEFAALEERLSQTEPPSGNPSPSHAELAALISEVRYELRGEEFDRINAGRKAAKVRKQTAKRVRKHRAKKAGHTP